MKNKFLLCFILITFFLAGCWDRVEIEERGFVIGVAIDKKDNNKLQITQQLTNTAGGDAGSSQSEQGQQNFLNVEDSGDSVFEAARKLATHSSRTPFFGHLQAVIVAREVAQSGRLSEVLDFFIRDPEMRRGSLILISDKKASDIFDIQPKNENAPTMYITSISENNFKNAEILPKIRIGDIQELLLQKKSFVVTMITKKGNELSLEGAAVIDGENHDMVGTLDRDGTVGLNYITDQIDGGYIKTFIDKNPVLFEIFNFQSKVSVDAKSKDDISFTIKIDTEGSLAETYLSEDYLNKQKLVELSKAIENEVYHKAMEAVDKAQNKFETDYIQLIDYIKQENYPVWKEVQSNWDRGENYFSKAKINVKVNVRIRTSGAVNQTKNE